MYNIKKLQLLTPGINQEKQLCAMISQTLGQSQAYLSMFIQDFLCQSFLQQLESTKVLIH